MTATVTGTTGLGDALRLLRDELTGALDVPCVIGEPPSPPPDSYVRLDTLRLRAPLRTDASVARINADVLVDAYAADHVTSADLAARCLLSVLASRHWELLPDQPDLAIWTALGRPPTAAFMVTIPVTQAVAHPVAPPVRQGLDLRTMGLRPLRGRILAADGTPLAGARVRALPNGLPVVADQQGRWALSVPDVLIHLDVLAKGTHTTYDVPPDAELQLGPSSQVRPPLDITLAHIGANPAP